MARLRLAQVMPFFERVTQLQQVARAFRTMKKLTLSESAWELYRLNTLKRVWQSGLTVFLRETQQTKAVLQDVTELYNKKLVAKALVCLFDHS